MAGFEYLADAHHVDDAGNLSVRTYVDFRDPADSVPITVLRKASSKRHAIPGRETFRLSEPACFPEQGRRTLPAAASRTAAANGWLCRASIAPETAGE